MPIWQRVRLSRRGGISEILLVRVGVRIFDQRGDFGLCCILSLRRFDGLPQGRMEEHFARMEFFQDAGLAGHAEFGKEMRGERQKGGQGNSTFIAEGGICGEGPPNLAGISWGPQSRTFLRAGEIFSLPGK